MSSTLLCSASRFRVRAFVLAFLFFLLPLLLIFLFSVLFFFFYRTGSFVFVLGWLLFFPAVQQTTDRIGNRAVVGAR